MNDKLLDFYRTLQLGLQNHIHHVLDEVSPMVEEAGASLGDLSFCFGSTFASILHELTRTSEDPLSEEDQELLESMLEPFVIGFKEKLDLLAKPDGSRLEVVHE